jgi:hypothetical protein
LGEARLRADDRQRRASRLGLALVVALWGIGATIIVLAIYRRAAG